jgi:hypothetical protein
VAIERRRNSKQLRRVLDALLMKTLATRRAWASLLVLQLSSACSGVISMDGYERSGEVADLGAAASGGGSNSSAGSSTTAGGSAGDRAEGGGGSTSVAGEAGSGETGDDEAGSGEPPDENRVYCDAVTEVFQLKCAPSCHGNDRVAIGDFALGLEHAATLVDKPSIRNAACGLVIDSANPSGSLILTKVTGGYFRDDIDCGGAMPVGSLGDMPPDEVSCIADWLQQFKR